jgi:ADP-ribosylglycohydrolase
MEEAWENAEETLAHDYKHPSYISALEAILSAKSEKPKGSGYVVDSLWSARAACQESTYVSIVKTAIAFGNDTDTTACIAGGLAGIYFGFESIPLRWLDILRGRELVKPLEKKLLLIRS